MSNSFDIVSKVDLNEINNAINMAVKELNTRFDLKGSSSEIKMEDGEIVLISADDFKLKAVKEILEQKLVKRSIPMKALQYGKIEDAFSGNVRQHIKLQEGIPTEKAKDIVKIVKRSGIKVQVAIQGDSLRVSGKKKDDLQETINLIKEKVTDIHLQFTNYR
ncbi:MAG: YajQ family cyclic di-GMP-binding protein [Acidobacteria bacterium]|nr:YajQ family cyclic di-GMP-binding protein [Acidobacteriota bacterium]